MNIINSALGRYETGGYPEEADCVIGHSFGTVTGDGSINRLLADYIIENGGNHPIILDRMLADAFPEDKREDIAHVVEGPITSLEGGKVKGVGTWGTLEEAKEFMRQESLKKAMMVAQAHHIGRVMMQAEKLGIDAAAPPDLPGRFDFKSKQLWTKSALVWVPAEVAGSYLLRKEGKL